MISAFVHDPPYIGKHKTGGVDLGASASWRWASASCRSCSIPGSARTGSAARRFGVWTALCVFGLVALVIRELTAPHPIVDLRALKDRTFAAGVFLMTMLGFVLYASLVLLPIFCRRCSGYPALQAGLALSPRGLGSLVMMPIAGQLTNRYDPRKLHLIGLVVGAWSMFSLSHLNLNAGYWDIFWPQVIQGGAMAFLFIPLMAVSMSAIRQGRWATPPASIT